MEGYGNTSVSTCQNEISIISLFASKSPEIKDEGFRDCVLASYASSKSLKCWKSSRTFFCSEKCFNSL